MQYYYNIATKAIIIISLTFLLHLGPNDIEISFSEIDYQVVEGERAFEVVVTKLGDSKSPLFLTLTPLTFSEFHQGRYPLPDGDVFDELNIIDPAEC